MNDIQKLVRSIDSILEFFSLARNIMSTITGDMSHEEACEFIGSDLITIRECIEYEVLSSDIGDDILYNAVLNACMTVHMVVNGIHAHFADIKQAGQWTWYHNMDLQYNKTYLLDRGCTEDALDQLRNAAFDMDVNWSSTPRDQYFAMVCEHIKRKTRQRDSDQITRIVNVNNKSGNISMHFNSH